MSEMHILRRTALSVALLALLSAAAHGQTAIAHWSFDTPTITTGPNGILTAEDVAGSHDATSIFNGTGVAINSVSGQFGQGAQFTNIIGNQPANNAYMNFSSLSEISGSTAGDFTFAAWANIPVGTATTDDNPIIADWGDSPAGTHRFTYWFQLDNVDTNTGFRPRAQIRAANAPPDPATIDVISTTLNQAQAGGTAGAPDGAWHHYAWAWNKSAGTMTFFIDGVQRHVQTTTQTNKDLLISDSLVQQLGAKRDNNRYFSGTMDEVWVFDSELTPEQVTTLVTQNGFGPPPLPGDTDGDGIPGEFPDDFDPIKLNFRKPVTQRIQGDLVRDNVVDFKDFREWKTAHLAAGGTLEGVNFDFVAVPEPNTLSLLFLASCVLLRRSRMRS